MSEVAKHKIPTAVSVKPVLKLIKAHLSSDDVGFKDAAMEVAKELELNGEQELYLYIYAQYGMVNTFEITD